MRYKSSGKGGSWALGCLRKRDDGSTLLFVQPFLDCSDHVGTRDLVHLSNPARQVPWITRVIAETLEQAGAARFAVAAVEVFERSEQFDEQGLLGTGELARVR